MNQPSDTLALEAEIDRVRSLGIEALRSRWRFVFGAKPPAGLTKDIIGRMLAYRIQEDAIGGLDKETTKLLDRLGRGGKSGAKNRRLKPGTIVVREYQGERYTVTVAPDGFVWQGTTYSSLTTIAKAITGTAWNGPRFFGLRVASDADDDPVACVPVAKPIKRGRSSVRASQFSRGAMNG
jgi:hypothetical protein